VSLDDYEDISGQVVKTSSASIATLPATQEDVETDSEDSEEPEPEPEPEKPEPNDLGTPFLASAVLFGGILLAGLAAYLKLTDQPMQMHAPYASRDFF
jgi:hypothetical protein